MRGIVHYQIGLIIFHSKIEHAHYIGMYQLRQRLGFDQEGSSLCICERHAQDLQCSEAFEVHMLAQVDIGKSTTTKQTMQPIVAKLMAHPVDHSVLPRI